MHVTVGLYVRWNSFLMHCNIVMASFWTPALHLQPLLKLILASKSTNRDFSFKGLTPLVAQVFTKASKLFWTISSSESGKIARVTYMYSSLCVYKGHQADTQPAWPSQSQIIFSLSDGDGWVYSVSRSHYFRIESRFVIDTCSWLCAAPLL